MYLQQLKFRLFFHSTIFMKNCVTSFEDWDQYIGDDIYTLPTEDIYRVYVHFLMTKST